MLIAWLGRRKMKSRLVRLIKFLLHRKIREPTPRWNIKSIAAARDGNFFHCESNKWNLCSYNNQTLKCIRGYHFSAVIFSIFVQY